MAETFNNGETGSSVRAKINAAIDEINDNTTALTTKQPLDADLTAIAALTPSDNDFLMRFSAAWTNRTVAQVKTTLSLNNVDNTSDVNKPTSTAQAADIAAAISDKQVKNSADTLNYNVLTDNAAQVLSSITQNKTLFFSTPVGPISYTLNGAGSTFPIGGEILIFNNGAAPDITLTAAGGVTIYYNGTLTADITTKKGGRVIRVATNTWWRVS